MSGIFERLFPDTWDFGGPERQAALEQTARLREELAGKLDQPEKNLLDSLCDAYIRESNCEIRDAYTQGVFDGMELMMEYVRQRSPPDRSVPRTVIRTEPDCKKGEL